MPCNHKFQQHLQLQQLGYQPETLIVGTFEPAWPGDNPAQWFYGRTASNFFWDILPRLYGEESLLHAGPAEWQAFCRRHRIALTDLISCIDDAEEDNKEHHRIMASYADPALVYHFDDFEFVDIVGLLRSFPIRNVYLTRGITEAFWKHAWGSVARYAHQHGLHEAQLLSPTAEADYHFQSHNTANPTAPLPTIADYVLHRWRGAWHG